MLPVPYIMGLVPAPNTARPSRPANGSRHRPPRVKPDRKLTLVIKKFEERTSRRTNDDPLGSRS